MSHRTRGAGERRVRCFRNTASTRRVRSRWTWLTGLLLALPAIAPAAEFGLSAGASVTSSADYWTPSASLDVAGARRNAGRLVWQPVASLTWIDARDIDSPRQLDLDRDVFVAGAGLRLVDWWGGAFFSLQLGYASDQTTALSSHEQFVSTLGWQGQRVLLQVRHISNAGFFGGRNLGETLFMAGARF